ncbi:unnamed protein product [Musa textilis]
MKPELRLYKRDSSILHQQKEGGGIVEVRVKPPTGRPFAQVSIPSRASCAMMACGVAGEMLTWARCIPWKGSQHRKTFFTVCLLAQVASVLFSESESISGFMF